VTGETVALTAAPAAAELRPADRRFGLRVFATPADEPRARRASDVIVLVGGGLALAAAGVVAVPEAGSSRALARYAASLPGALDGLWQVLVDGLVLLAVVVVVVAAWNRRLTIARDLLVAAAVALAVGLVVGQVVEAGWPSSWAAVRSAGPPPWFPSLRVAVPAAVVITSMPHLVLPLRRVGRWAVGLAMAGVVILGAATPVGALGGLLVAAMAAAAVHLAFGSSSGRPGLGLVRAALAELGVPITSLSAADRQEAGLFVVHGTDEAGAPLVVKVYGRDAYDTALVSSLWRAVWYRDPGTPLRLGRLQQVEHEAFLTLLARQNGVATDTVVTAGATVEGDALLVLRPAGRPVGEAPADAADVVRGAWALLHRLHAGSIAHGQVDERHLVVLDDGEVGAVDFRGATVAATSAQRRIDEAQLFVTTLALVGEDGAVVAAHDALGADGLTAMLPYLQPTVLTPDQRRLVKQGGLDLDGARRRAAETTGAKEPDLQRLRRITLGTLIQVVLPAVAVVALLSGLAGLDLEEVSDILADARWWLVAIGFLLTQVPRLTQAVATLGAAPVPLPLGPVYALQLAVSYVNIAVPTSAARMAVNIRFFQRHGVPPGAALAAGAIDGFCGFVVQAILLTSLLLFTPASLDLRIGDAVDEAEHLLLVVAAIAAVSVVVAVALRRVRRFVVVWAKRLKAEAAMALRGLRSPRRLALLFGGNLATEVLFAASLGVFVQSLGYSVGLGELLVVNISVALLSGLLPIPGGIGVAEGGLTFGLVQCGVPEEVALAATLLYRLASFYLPPVWGFFAMRWLERHEHL
jgi:glycosyltransferase 2 family protein